MISARQKRFIEETDYAFVASADEDGHPHLAAGQGLRVPDAEHVVFEAWFCRKTLENVARNPRLTLAVVDPASRCGYQLDGVVESAADIAILDGFAAGDEPPGTPQVQSRLVVRVEEILEFSGGAHSDIPLSGEV